MKRQRLLILIPVLLAILLIAGIYAERKRSSNVVKETPSQPTPTPAQEIVIYDAKARQDVLPSGAPMKPVSQEVVGPMSAALKEHLQKNPNDANAHFNLGSLYYQAKRYQEAVESLEKAIKNDPKDADARYTLGNAYEKLQRYEDAAAQFKELTRIEPKNDTVHYNLANAYLNLKRYDEAIQHYKQAIALNGKNSMAHFGLGFVYSRTEKPNEAVDECNKAIAIDPKNADARYLLGVLKLANGDQAGAREQQEQLKNLKSPYADDLARQISG